MESLYNQQHLFARNTFNSHNVVRLTHTLTHVHRPLTKVIASLHQLIELLCAISHCPMACHWHAVVAIAAAAAAIKRTIQSIHFAWRALSSSSFIFTWAKHCCDTISTVARSKQICCCTAMHIIAWHVHCSVFSLVGNLEVFDLLHMAVWRFSHFILFLPRSFSWLLAIAAVAATAKTVLLTIRAHLREYVRVLARVCVCARATQWKYISDDWTWTANSEHKLFAMQWTGAQSNKLNQTKTKTWKNRNGKNVQRELPRENVNERWSTNQKKFRKNVQ